MASFNDAFAAARKKFEASGKKEDFTFDWNGKSYNVLRKGETKSSLMNKNVKSELAPKESPKPKARGSAPVSSKRPKARVEGPNVETSKRPKARAEGSAPTESKRPKARGKIPYETWKDMTRSERREANLPETTVSWQNQKADAPKKEERKPTEYKDDEKAARTGSTGTVPKGYNRVRIPGMAKGGVVGTPGQFKKSGSPRGYK